MRSRGEFPKAVKRGSITVKVYRIKRASTAGWVYAVAWNSGEGRKMVQFANEPSAMEEARLKAAQLSAGRIEAGEMNRTQRHTCATSQPIRERNFVEHNPALVQPNMWHSTASHKIPERSAILYPSISITTELFK